MHWTTNLLRPALRRYPLLRGRSRLEKTLLDGPQDLPEGKVVPTRHNTRVRVRRDGMFVEIFLFGEYEPVHTRVYREIVRPGDYVLDVGANFGWYTALFGRWVGATGRVYAFEPVPFIADQTEDTIRLNRAERNTELVRRGLSDSAGEFVIHTFGGLPHGYASLSTLGRDDAIEHRCQLTTLDAFVDERALPAVDFLKIDVEGHELAALRGGTELLERDDAPIVAFETNRECLEHTGTSAAEIQALLQARGYTELWGVNRRGRVERVHRPIEDIDHDYLCAKPARARRLVDALERSGFPVVS